MSVEEKDIIEQIFGKPVMETKNDGDDRDYSYEDGAVAMEQAITLDAAISERPGNTISHPEKVAMLEALMELESRIEKRGHFKYFPDDGTMYAYDKYVKHMEFMRLGARFRERMFMAGNRIGKSIAGGYELTCHLTGQYPTWWEGRRFPQAVDCWAAGDTGQTTRDIVQSTLLGERGQWGTGLIPGDCIIEMRMRPGIPDAVDTVRIRHSSGRESKLGFKSYDQKRRAFQGTSKDVIWLDEEPPIEVYGECLMRTMTTNGIVFVTFTPLMGITPFVQEFLDAARSSDSK